MNAKKRLLALLLALVLLVSFGAGVCAAAEDFSPQGVMERATLATVLRRLFNAFQMPGAKANNAPENVPEGTNSLTQDKNKAPAPAPKAPEDGIIVEEDGMIAVDITVERTVFAARFYDNASVRAILEQMPFSLNMSDYARQEKVTGLSFSLPEATGERPNTIKAGEIYLWSGNQLVLFYTTFTNSYSYVPVGYIEDTSGLTAALGSGSVTVTFSIP